MRTTIAVIQRTLLSDGLVYRYRDTEDGLAGGEAAFAACGFWLVENLTALEELAEARRLFESLIARATPLGLFAEELEPLPASSAGTFHRRSPCSPWSTPPWRSSADSHSL